MGSRETLSLSVEPDQRHRDLPPISFVKSRWLKHESGLKPRGSAPRQSDFSDFLLCSSCATLKTVRRNRPNGIKRSESVFVKDWDSYSKLQNLHDNDADGYRFYSNVKTTLGGSNQKIFIDNCDFLCIAFNPLGSNHATWMITRIVFGWADHKSARPLLPPLDGHSHDRIHHTFS